MFSESPVAKKKVGLRFLIKLTSFGISVEQEEAKHNAYYRYIHDNS